MPATYMLDDPHREILPDVRARNGRGSLRGPGGNWIPIHCANCGRSGGIVPEENCTFAFYLCTPCGDRWGTMAHHYAEPESIFWQRVGHEQLDKHQRLLTPMELLTELQRPQSPLSKIFKDGIGLDGAGKRKRTT